MAIDITTPYNAVLEPDLDGILTGAGCDWATLTTKQPSDVALFREDARITAREARLAVTEQPGDHDYHGPSKPDPDNPGARRSVPDPVHERFHGAVGDVLAGRVIPEARRQMQEALKTAPKNPPTTASTSKPMPGEALSKGVDPRRMGLA